MSISLNGYKNETTTFACKDITAGEPVKMAQSNTVASGTDGADFIGAAINQRGDCAAVQTDGYVEFAYTGTAPAVGYANLACNGVHGVKVLSTAHPYKVVSVNTTDKKVGIIL